MWFYLFFLLLVLLLYWRQSKLWQNLLLTCLSLLFYGWINWRFPVFLIVFSTTIFFLRHYIVDSPSHRSKKKWLFVNLALGLGCLSYFKYANFFINNIVLITNSIGYHISNFEIYILLPLGISFLTFSALTYPLDLYFNKRNRTVSFVEFITFVTFLPKLFAGPIARAHDFMKVLSERRKFNIENFEDGCIRILTGCFKKIVIADNMAIYLVNPVTSAPDSYSTMMLWLAMFGYAIQIYADFSGYSNVAIGSAKILGLRIPENFSFPYLATHFSDFWRRWHITMSTFFRDYVYIPLGGSRKGNLRTALNLLLTMLICGLWHGPSWLFVIWGGLHGFYLIVDRYINLVINQIEWGEAGKKYWLRWCGRIFRWSYTQILVCFAWVLFSSPNFTLGISYLRNLFAGGSDRPLLLAPAVTIGFIAFFIDHLYGWSVKVWPEIDRRYIPLRAVAYSFMIIMLFQLVPEKRNPFIYFQF